MPAASSEALTHVDGLDVDVLHCAAGHVAMLAGHEAHRVRCPGLDAFLVPHGAPSATQVALEG